MSLVAIDTSVVVAALQAWHDDHRRCVAALDEALTAPPVVLAPEGVEVVEPTPAA